MSSGGGALGYKEPPHSKLKKLWATTDPLEQNSKSGRTVNEINQIDLIKRFFKSVWLPIAITINGKSQMHRRRSFFKFSLVIPKNECLWSHHKEVTTRLLCKLQDGQRCRPYRFTLYCVHCKENLQEGTVAVVNSSSSNRCYVVWAASGGLILRLPVSWPISPESSRPIIGLGGRWLASPCQLTPAPRKHCHLAAR